MNRFSDCLRSVRLLSGWAVVVLPLLLTERLPAQEALPLPLPDLEPPRLPPMVTPGTPDPVAGPGQAAGAVTPVPPTPVTPRTSAAAANSTSRSGQFIVYGPDLRIRSGLASRCEEIAEELNRLMRTPEPWVLKVVVEIKPLGPRDLPDAGIQAQVSALTHGGFHLQLTVPERAGLRPSDFRRELVRLLLTERILRTHKHVASETSARLLPDWVHTGVMEALDYKLRARPSSEFAAIFKSGKVYSIEEILDVEARGLDGLSRSIYEASSCALVLALLDQPEGAMRFSRFLAALAIEKKPQRELLNQWFPGLAESDSSLNKWWSLQMASLAKPTVAETLDPTMTAELLDRALTFLVMPRESVKLPTPKSVRSIASQRPAPLPEPTAAEIEATTLAAMPSLADTGSEGTAPTATLTKPKTAAPSKKPASGTSAGGAKAVSRRPKDVPAAPEVAEAEPAAGADADASDEGEGSGSGSGRRGFLRYMFPFNVLGGGAEAKAAEDEEGQEADKMADEKKADDKKAEASQKTEAKKEEPKPAAKPAAAAAPEPAKETDPEPAEGEMTERQKRRAERERLEAEEKAARDKAKAEKEAAEMAAKEAEDKKKAEERAAKAAEEEARKKAKEAERAAAKKPATEATPAEKTPPATEPEKPKEEGRGSKLNPFKWFRGGKKPEGGEGEDAKAEEAKAEAGKEGAALPWREMDAVWARFAQLRFEAPGERMRSSDWGAARFVQAPSPAPAPEPAAANAAPGKKEPVPKLPLEDRPDLLELPKLTPPPVPGQLDGAPAAPMDAKPGAASPTAPAPVQGGSAPTPPLPLPPPLPESTAAPLPPSVPATVVGAMAFPIEDYAVILAHPDKEQLLANARLSLQEVQLRGNVLFRGVAREYLGVLQDLVAGKTKGLDARLKALREKAAEAYTKACAVQDHLDWYEATQATRYSGLFEDFLNLPELIREELPPREDPISRYLDEVEARLGR